MHILTKILVVLVALLVAALVPLAAVSSTNQLAFKQKAADAESSLKMEQASARTARDMAEASAAALRERNSALGTQLATLAAQADAERTARAEFEKQVEQLRIQVADLTGQTNRLVANSSMQTRMIDEYNQIIEGARSKFLDSEKQKVELQTALARVQADLENESKAKDLLKEQLQKITEEKDRTAADLSRMVAQFGSGATSAGATADATMPVPADRSVYASVIDVRREADNTLAEINVGSKDGVKEGWVMLIADESSNFVGNLRIINVNVNRAVGVVELENASVRPVKAGNRAIARKGI